MISYSFWPQGVPVFFHISLKKFQPLAEAKQQMDLGHSLLLIDNSVTGLFISNT